MPLLQPRLEAASRQAGADAYDGQIERDPIHSDAEGKHTATGSELVVKSSNPDPGA